MGILYTLFKGKGARRIVEHDRAIIAFEDKHIGRVEGVVNRVCHFAEIGSPYQGSAAARERISDSVGSVVWYRKRAH